MIIRNCSDKIQCQFQHGERCGMTDKPIEWPCMNHPALRAWDRQKVWGQKEASPLLNHRTTLEAEHD